MKKILIIFSKNSLGHDLADYARGKYALTNKTIDFIIDTRLKEKDLKKYDYIYIEEDLSLSNYKYILEYNKNLYSLRNLLYKYLITENDQFIFKNKCKKLMDDLLNKTNEVKEDYYIVSVYRDIEKTPYIEDLSYIVKKEDFEEYTIKYINDFYNNKCKDEFKNSNYLYNTLRLEEFLEKLKRFVNKNDWIKKEEIIKAIEINKLKIEQNKIQNELKNIK